MGYFLHGPDSRLIPVGLSMRVGSDPESDIVINDADVAGCHAIIGVFPDGLLIRDEESPAGTFVNDERIDHVTALMAGDRVKVGKEVFIVEYEHSEI
jgi:pSer/pThr/pTyr-binding forkhead associated (FHA) protein